jgi:hypothetical protein
MMETHERQVVVDKKHYAANVYGTTAVRCDRIWICAMLDEKPNQRRSVDIGI